MGCGIFRRKLISLGELSPFPMNGQALFVSTCAYGESKVK